MVVTGVPGTEKLWGPWAENTMNVYVYMSDFLMFQALAKTSIQSSFGLKAVDPSFPQPCKALPISVGSCFMALCAAMQELHVAKPSRIALSVLPNNPPENPRKPKSTQEVPQESQRASHEAPKRRQEALKRLPTGSNRAQESPKRAPNQRAQKISLSFRCRCLCLCRARCRTQDMTSRRHRPVGLSNNTKLYNLLLSMFPIFPL